MSLKQYRSTLNFQNRLLVLIGYEIKSHPIISDQVACNINRVYLAILVFFIHQKFLDYPRIMLVFQFVDPCGKRFRRIT